MIKQLSVQTFRGQRSVYDRRRGDPIEQVERMRGLDEVYHGNGHIEFCREMIPRAVVSFSRKFGELG